VRELARSLYSLVVTSCKSSINPMMNANPATILWRSQKKSISRESNPGFPACSQSLYRLGYPSSNQMPTEELVFIAPVYWLYPSFAEHWQSSIQTACAAHDWTFCSSSFFCYTLLYVTSHNGSGGPLLVRDLDRGVSPLKYKNCCPFSVSQKIIKLTDRLFSILHICRNLLCRFVSVGCDVMMTVSNRF
jgi:hypothetical protein